MVVSNVAAPPVASRAAVEAACADARASFAREEAALFSAADLTKAEAGMREVHDDVLATTELFDRLCADMLGLKDQQDVTQRLREEEREQAARLIQRRWRGYAVRKLMRTRWRDLALVETCNELQDVRHALADFTHGFDELLRSVEEDPTMLFDQARLSQGFAGINAAASELEDAMHHVEGGGAEPLISAPALGLEGDAGGRRSSS